MALVTAGQTRHFLVRYEENAQPAALPVANALLATCEADLAKLSTSMPYMRGGLGDMFLEQTISIQVDSTQTGGPAPGGADNFGHSVGQPSLIRINPLNNVGGVLVQITDDYAGFL